MTTAPNSLSGPGIPKVSFTHTVFIQFTNTYWSQSLYGELEIPGMTQTLSLSYGLLHFSAEDLNNLEKNAICTPSCFPCSSLQVHTHRYHWYLNSLNKYFSIPTTFQTQGLDWGLCWPSSLSFMSPKEFIGNLGCTGLHFLTWMRFWEKVKHPSKLAYPFNSFVSC